MENVGLNMGPKNIRAQKNLWSHFNKYFWFKKVESTCRIPDPISIGKNTIHPFCSRFFLFWKKLVNYIQISNYIHICLLISWSSKQIGKWKNLIPETNISKQMKRIMMMIWWIYKI